MKHIIDKVKITRDLASGTLYYQGKDFGNEYDNADKLMEYLTYPRKMFTFSFEHICEDDSYMEHLFLEIIKKD